MAPLPRAGHQTGTSENSVAFPALSQVPDRRKMTVLAVFMTSDDVKLHRKQNGKANAHWSPASPARGIPYEQPY
jgi:hypothetical protein